jgi:hypothetical protein
MTKNADLSQFKVGCSNIHLIMGAAKNSITDKQLIELDELKLKPSPTPKQKEKIDELTAKRDATEDFLTKDCRSYLLEIYAEWKYGRRYQLKSLPGESKGVPQMMKGILAQNDSISLLSQVTGTKFTKYTTQVENKWLTGRLDIINGETLELATRVDEIKTNYKLNDFIKNLLNKDIDKNNMYQIQGYMSITGKETAVISYCLVDHPESTISEQKLIHFYKTCPDGEETPEFLNSWLEIEASLRFSDIKPKDRVISYNVDRDDDMIRKIHDRVEMSREWIKEFSSMHEAIIKKRYINE